MAAIERISTNLPPDSPARKRDHVILPPGRIYASAGPVNVITTVGSGVAVCLWDTESQMGGLIHYLLPATNGWEQALRCGSGAIPALLERLVSIGARRARMIAKIFGGSRLIPTDIAHGAMNIRTAVDVLNASQIPIAAADIEGDRARRLVFHADDGRTWIKKL